MLRATLGTVASLCALSGCGAIVESGTPVDAAPDADLHGVVSVTVLDINGNGAPAPNIPVVFIDPDGTIDADVVTDGNGRASATVLPGASVHAVYQQIRMSTFTSGTVTTNTTTTIYKALTILDVKPGDDLPIGFTDRDNTQTSSFNVSYTPFPNATGHTIVTPCGTSFGGVSGSASVTMRKSCQRDKFDVLVIASDANGVRAGAIATDVNLSAGSAAVPNQYTSSGPFRTTYSDIPPEITDMSMERVAGVSSTGFTSSSSCAPSAGACTMNLPSVPTVGPKSIVATFYTRGSGQDQVFQAYEQRVAGNNLNYTLDVGTNLLPWMSGLTFDVTTSTLVPVLDAPDTVSDVFGADLLFTRSTSSTSADGTVVTVLETDVERLFVGPTAEPIKLPVLPPHMGPLDYQPTDTVTDIYGLRIDSSNANGWDEARARAFDLVDGIQIFTTNDDMLRGSFQDFPLPSSMAAKRTGSTRPAERPLLRRSGR